LENLSTTRPQLPIVLLDDIYDSLDLPNFVSFWRSTVVPTYPLLFSPTLWKGNSPLVFLRVVNRVLRSCEDEPGHLSVHGDLLQTLAAQYPLQEKLSYKAWGTHNLENSTEFEGEEEAVAVLKDSGLDAQSPISYSLYQAFWELQKDFSSPYSITIADFLRRVDTCVKAMESSDDAVHHIPSKTSRPYLTGSRLLTYQIRCDGAFRRNILTQILILSHHMISQVPSLVVKLQPLVKRACALLGEAAATKIEELLSTTEGQWRQWKQSKGTSINLDHAMNSDLPPAKKAKREWIPKYQEDEMMDEDEHAIIPIESLAPLSCGLRKTPTLKEHLVEYTEALDPESGIETAYYPTANALYSWRAVRMIGGLETPRSEYLLSSLSTSGDLERSVRKWSKHADVEEIPGDCPPSSPEHVGEEDDDDVEEEIQETIEQDIDDKEEPEKVPEEVANNEESTETETRKIEEEVVEEVTDSMDIDLIDVNEEGEEEVLDPEAQESSTESIVLPTETQVNNDAPDNEPPKPESQSSETKSPPPEAKESLTGTQTTSASEKGRTNSQEPRNTGRNQRSRQRQGRGGSARAPDDRRQDHQRPNQRRRSDEERGRMEDRRPPEPRRDGGGFERRDMFRQDDRRPERRDERRMEPRRGDERRDDRRGDHRRDDRQDNRGDERRRGGSERRDDRRDDGRGNRDRRQPSKRR